MSSSYHTPPPPPSVVLSTTAAKTTNYVGGSKINKRPNNSIQRNSSSITLPSIRIRYKAFIIYTFILIITLIAAVEQFREFIINERALLTYQGRARYRNRQRKHHKSTKCDETTEPKPWQRIGYKFVPLKSEWKQLSSCVEYDLSLRKRQLGDAGVKRLVSLLERKEYATKYWNGQLRVLNLERQGITRRGAGYLARWLSVDPLEADSSVIVGRDVDRMPTAASLSLYINLEGNPIGILGVKDLERAVEKARINGIRVVIVGGGSSNDMLTTGNTKNNVAHVVKLGPIEYTRKSVEMSPWRLPCPWYQRLSYKLKSNVVRQSIVILVVFGLGIVVGRVTYGQGNYFFPYRLAIVRTDSEG